MSLRRGFALRELLAVLACMGAASCLLPAMAPKPKGLPARTLENLRTISQAAQLYR